jgi:uncharacterized protein (TIGR02284 family)
MLIPQSEERKTSMPEHIALDKVEVALRELIDRLRGEQEGFRDLGHRLQNDRAKRFFLEETQRRAEYAAELENELHRMGVHDVKEEVSRASKARLFWGELQASMAGGQKAVLSTAEKFDEGTLKIYAAALKQELPLPLREMLDRQQAHIQRSHDQSKALRDLG